MDALEILELRERVPKIAASAELKAVAEFETYTLIDILYSIERMPDEKESYLKEIRRKAIDELKKNKPFDASEINIDTVINTMTLALQVWCDDDYAPADFQEDPEQFVKSTCYNVFKYNSIISYCNSQLLIEDVKCGIKTDFTLNQINFIFDRLEEMNIVASNSKYNFIAAFQEAPLPDGWDLILWKGYRSLVRYFMDQMAGNDIVSFVNEYIKHIDGKPFDSHDKHSGRGYLKIKWIFDEAKALK